MTRTLKRPLTIAVAALLSSAPTALCQLNSFIQESGAITLSVDAGGNNLGTGYSISVEKPTGATVRRAFFVAASTSFAGPGVVIPDSTMALAGTPVSWDTVVANNAGSVQGVFRNHLADVTAIVAPIINSAPAGTLQLSVTEGSLNSVIEGSLLAVIFDDPNVTQNKGIILLFGGQDTNGDQFIINLAEPLDLSGSAIADMGLGISFSAQNQAQGDLMVSLIDVNGQRLTSSAGGEDDGLTTNGALITVGGVGDTNDNPSPLSPPNEDPFFDDELWNLIPFTTQGDRQIVVNTVNPSDDDNIFFGYFVTSVPIIVDEGILLTPLASEGKTGQPHQVTAVVLDNDGQPIPNRPVTFSVIAGPNGGDGGGDTTDAQGEATFSYVGDGGVGVDVIVANMLDSAGAPVSSNQAIRTWNPVGAFNFYGCGLNPDGSLVVLSGEPNLGELVKVGIDNPLQTQGPGTKTALFIGLAPDPAFPCGTPGPMARWGMDPSNNGEFLIDLTGKFFVILGGDWDGENPVSYNVPIPNDSSLVGMKIYLEGVMFTPGGDIWYGPTVGIEMIIGC